MNQRWKTPPSTRTEVSLLGLQMQDGVFLSSSLWQRRKTIETTWMKEEAAMSQRLPRRPYGTSNFMCHEMMHRIIPLWSSTKKEKRKIKAASLCTYASNCKKQTKQAKTSKLLFLFFSFTSNLKLRWDGRGGGPLFVFFFSPSEMSATPGVGFLGREGLQSNSSPPSVCLAPDPPLMPRPCAKNSESIREALISCLTPWRTWGSGWGLGGGWDREGRTCVEAEAVADAARGRVSDARY